MSNLMSGSVSGNVSGSIIVPSGGGSGIDDFDITASVDDVTGTPYADVTKGGTADHPVFNIAFHNIKGAQGIQGVQGPTGLDGPTGPAGPTGPQGPQGDPGIAGPQGPRGLTGPEGPQGPQGPEGPEGPQGQQGQQGPTGATGAQGPQGPQGPIGFGVAAGGTTGQILTKVSNGNYDTGWIDLDADAVAYDNTGSGMAATDTQGAIDELNSNLTNLGNTYTGSWTATSSSANQTQLTEKKRVNKGTYLIIGSTPACSVANLFMQIAWQKGTGTVNTTGFNYSRDFSHFSYVVTITDDDTDVWVRSASSASCTFSNTGYGWFKLIRIK